MMGHVLFLALFYGAVVAAFLVPILLTTLLSAWLVDWIDGDEGRDT